ncbi:hypothetical protein Clacol_003615 [Clathrus columnatus]|uniref:Proline dehydrogenase n=1 Tax=Clathrus columnatus TaxID=1419009 RepID=A0AAV5A7F3_9AGAM|nr:hypothetical protein Clacol_003615 [Clathrus columnatus]
MVFLRRPASFSRYYATLSKSRKTSHVKRGVCLFSVLGGSAYCLNTKTIHADNDSNDTALRHTPLSTLLRSYVVYSLCSLPIIVNNSPAVISAVTAVPGLKQIAEVVIRYTFFAQFVGGDTAEDTLPILAKLRHNNIGALLAYSVEVDEDEADKDKSKIASPNQVYKSNIEETINSIDVAADFEEQYRSKFSGKTWVAVKLTALLPRADSLIKLSDHLIRTRPSSKSSQLLPGIPNTSDLQSLIEGRGPADLTQDDIKDLKELYISLTRIVERAYQRNVKIIIDAEYTWYQPAIDAFTFSLMRRYNNRIPDSTPNSYLPLVYGTYQAYLKRTPQFLAQSLKDARDNGYALGVKLVRGAYHHFELTAAPSPDVCPVWSTKPETDNCFDSCADVLISTLKDGQLKKVNLGILFGTHNTASCDKILGKLVKNGLAAYVEGKFMLKDRVAEHCAIAQLYGMSDSLTDSLVEKVHSSTPFIIKYIPYGPLLAVMPYLGRRAIENSSILSGDGGAIAERQRVGKELRRRLFGGLTIF